MSTESEFSDTLGELIKTLIHSSMGNLSRYARKKGLSFHQMSCMFRMRKKGGLRVKEVGEMFKISTPAASQFLDKLVNMGLVIRDEDLKDRRVKNHKLTEKGDMMVLDFFTHAKGVRNKISEKFEKDELELMIPVLKRLTGLFKEENECLNC